MTTKLRQPKPCEACGTTFVPHTSNAKYCTLRCQKAADRRRRAARDRERALGRVGNAAETDAQQLPWFAQVAGDNPAVLSALAAALLADPNLNPVRVFDPVTDWQPPDGLTLVRFDSVSWSLSAAPAVVVATPTTTETPSAREILNNL